MTTAQALESVLNAWVNGRKVRDGIPLTIRQQAEQALLTADAQATVEALQAIIKQMGEQAAVLAKDGMAAKAQVEALQRELEHAKKMEAVQKEVADNQTWHVRELRAALDAEREKVKGLHEITKVICAHCCEPMEIPSKAVLQTQLSQLQALEAMTERERVRYRQALCSIATSTCCVGCEEAKKVARATLSEDVQTWEQYRATLDATTPAVCPDCNGDGAVDSGGTDPNGNPLMRRCGCREKGGDGE